MDKQTKLLTMKIITSTMKIITFFSFKNIQYLLWGTTNCYSQKCYFQVACSLAFWYADERLSLTNLSQGRLSAKLILKYRKNYISNYLLGGGLCFGLWGFFFLVLFFFLTGHFSVILNWHFTEVSSRDIHLATLIIPFWLWLANSNDQSCQIYLIKIKPVLMMYPSLKPLMCSSEK